jgi:hypothetical protein
LHTVPNGPPSDWHSKCNMLHDAHHAQGREPSLLTPPPAAAAALLLGHLQPPAAASTTFSHPTTRCNAAQTHLVWPALAQNHLPGTGTG